MIFFPFCTFEEVHLPAFSWSNWFRLKCLVVVEWPPQVPVYQREHKGSCQTSHIVPFYLPMPHADPRTTAGQTLSGKSPTAQEPAPSLLVKRCNRHGLRTDFTKYTNWFEVCNTFLPTAIINSTLHGPDSTVKCIKRLICIWEKTVGMNNFLTTQKNSCYSKD